MSALKANLPIAEKCCSGPFTDMYLQRGWASTCCPIWYRQYDTTPDYYQTPEHLWRNAHNEALRRMVGVNDYSMCDRCPFREKRAKVSAGWELGPRTMYVGDSFVCNLGCWSCRSEKILKEPNPEEADRFLRSLLEGYRDSLRTVSFLHTGEVFASQRHVDLINEFDWQRIKLELITNGTLVSKHWKRIRHMHQSIKRVTFSIDAATSGTYAKVRGGVFESAVEGIEIIHESVPEVDFHYVVSADNCHEIEPFVEWVLRYNPVRVKLVRMARTYDRGDWDQKDAWLPEHPSREVLEDQLDRVKAYPEVVLRGFD